MPTRRSGRLALLDVGGTRMGSTERGPSDTESEGQSLETKIEQKLKERERRAALGFRRASLSR